MAAPTLDRPSISLTKYFPFLDWLVHYRRENLFGDVIAGVIVAVMLVPQAMAYALLAGLPPQIGLYASILPLMIYGLLGTSRALSVGPTAITSILVATGVGQFAEIGTVAYLELALMLALMVGIIQFGMGVMRIGFIVNFLSHPVLTGFTSAAAIVISISQLKHILGLDVPSFDYDYETLAYIVEHLSEVNVATFFIGIIGIAILLYFQRALPGQLRRWRVPEAITLSLTKTGPLVVVVFGTLVVALFSLDSQSGVAIVGEVPPGLPSITIPIFDLESWQMLLPSALTISLIGFMESISVGKSLASKRRQKLDSNQELIALGAANFGAAFTGGYPVTGGLSRSVVNFTAGANTGLASILTSILIALTVTLFMPLFFFLPRAVLAVIIVVAIFKLFDYEAFVHAWHYSKNDALSMMATFGVVLILGIETGIIVGVAVSIMLYLWRTSRPHFAIVGRVGETEHFRNVLRHDVQTLPHVLIMRVDESLYFANTQYLEDEILGVIADNPKVDHFVLVCSAVNFIDTSALEVLEKLVDELQSAGVRFYMAEVKGPVMDRLKDIGFIDKLGADNVFLSTHHAMVALDMPEYSASQ